MKDATHYSEEGQERKKRENDGEEEKMDKEENGENGKGGEGKEEEEPARVCNPSLGEAKQETHPGQHGLHKETVSKEHNQTKP